MHVPSHPTIVCVAMDYLPVLFGASMSPVGHPNVVSVVKALEDHSHVHIIMELCSGGDLVRGLVAGCGTLPPCHGTSWHVCQTP